MKIEKDPAGRRPFSYDTPSWSHFGTGEGWAYGRCNRYLDHVYSTRAPNDDTVNCWKVLVFEDAVTDFEQVKTYLVERAGQDPTLLGKWQRGKNQLAVVYATSEERRDELRSSMIKDLRQMGIMKKGFLPYRRGCKQFEKVLGDWHGWKAGERKPVLEEIVSIELLKED